MFAYSSQLLFRLWASPGGQAGQWNKCFNCVRCRKMALQFDWSSSVLIQQVGQNCAFPWSLNWWCEKSPGAANPTWFFFLLLLLAFNKPLDLQPDKAPKGPKTESQMNGDVIESNSHGHNIYNVSQHGEASSWLHFKMNILKQSRCTVCIKVYWFKSALRPCCRCYRHHLLCLCCEAEQPIKKTLAANFPFIFFFHPKPIFLNSVLTIVFLIWISSGIVIIPHCSQTTKGCF